MRSTYSPPLPNGAHRTPDCWSFLNNLLGRHSRTIDGATLRSLLKIFWQSFLIWADFICRQFLVVGVIKERLLMVPIRTAPRGILPRKKYAKNSGNCPNPFFARKTLSRPAGDKRSLPALSEKISPAFFFLGKVRQSLKWPLVLNSDTISEVVPPDGGHRWL